MSKILLVLLLLFSCLASAETMMIQVEPGIILETTILKPEGDGPFPMVVINHGKNAGRPKNQKAMSYDTLGNEFVKRGYIVVQPMRRGFANSTGFYHGSSCELYEHGMNQAEDIDLIVELLSKDPWVDPNNILIIGQSYGGLATMAYGTYAHPGVKGLINFAGGLMFWGGCHEWKKSLVKAFESFGGRTTIPSLWYYGRNDSHFDIELSTEMHNAYNDAGGKATMVNFGPYAHDSHGLISWTDGPDIYWPEMEAFLTRVGLPTAIKH